MDDADPRVRWWRAAATCAVLAAGIAAGRWLGSYVPLIASGWILGVDQLRSRRALDPEIAVAVCALGLAPVASLRTFEYGRDASVFDPYFAVLVLGTAAGVAVLALWSATGAWSHGRRRNAVLCLLALPVSYVLMGLCIASLSAWLNIYYK